MSKAAESYRELERYLEKQQTKPQHVQKLKKKRIQRRKKEKKQKRILCGR